MFVCIPLHFCAVFAPTFSVYSIIRKKMLRTIIFKQQLISPPPKTPLVKPKTLKCL